MKSSLFRELLGCILINGGLAVAIAPASAAVSSPKNFADGAQFVINGGSLRIQFWAPEIARITYGNGLETPALSSLSVIATPAKLRLKHQENAQAFTLTTPGMKVQVDKRTGAISFIDAADHVLLREAADGRKFDPASLAGDSVTSAAQAFETAADEGIYGLGQHQRGVWNYNNGGNVRLAQANTDVGVPVLTSSKGYMLLWDNPAVTTITSSPDDTSPGHKVLRCFSEFAKAIDYYFCYADGTIDGAMKAYRHLTGDAPLMPKWELGFWQCKERYASQEELLGVASKLRELKVPVDGIIQDWQYWPPGTNTWGSHLFDPSRYPDPAGMFKQLHGMHYHTLISVWAKFDLGSDNSKELNALGGMYPQVTSYAFPPGHGQWYDPFSLAGRQTYWKQLRDELFSKGVDGWWLDAPEPEIGGMAFRGYKTGLGPGYAVYNAYPLMHSMGIYQGQRASTDKQRVVILTRSAYAGQQRNSAITWSGDITGTWQVLRNQIAGGLNFSLSGIPYWNTDTGGFFSSRQTGNGDPRNPRFQEFFTRWFQFSAFCPMFRVHSSSGLNPGREFYRFDQNTQGILRTYLDLRYRLLPYLYSTAWQVTANGSTFMRPLVMDFPGDQKALGISDQYLFGPALMVCPVTQSNAITRAVYLPANRAWTDFWTGNRYPCAQTIDAPAPIETEPLFVRAGSIVPMGPFIQYSSQKPADPIELRVYPGADGRFTLYEDEGDNYNYEKGAYATIPLSWDERKRTLEVGKRHGQFPGMLKQRTFHVVWVSENHGAGVGSTENPDAIVLYDGSRVAVVAK